MGRARSFPSRAGLPQRTQRRQTSWTAGPGGVVTQSATGSALFPFLLVPLLEGLTITRMRGELLLYLTSAASANDGFDGAVGIGLVSDEAAAVGITAVPTPIDDIDFEEWIWFQMFSLRSASFLADAAATDRDIPSAVSAVARIPIDNKAMRKFPVGKSLVGVIESAETGTAGITAFLSIRSLVTLP